MPQELPPIKPPEPKRIGDMNGWSHFMLKMFLISWPVFLTSFLAMVGYAFLWGGWVTKEIHTMQGFVTYGERFSRDDADNLQDDIAEDRRADLAKHVLELHPRTN